MIYVTETSMQWLRYVSKGWILGAVVGRNHHENGKPFFVYRMLRNYFVEMVSHLFYDASVFTVCRFERLKADTGPGEGLPKRYLTGSAVSINSSGGLEVN